MSASETRNRETDEEFLARLARRRAERKAKAAAAEEAAKPKIVATVSPKMAEAIKANPESLRVSAKGADETVVVDRPRRTEMLEVVAVDGQGRPSRVARVDCATGERSLLDYVDGYRQPNTVNHIYDPLKALENGND
jgi:isopentenyl diphosphate isomerase/L-lactate dehydrogenase-like FMN-dependent dehydrogenase